MARRRFSAAILAVLALSACSEADSITSPSGIPNHEQPGGTTDPGTGGTSGGGTDTTTTPTPIDTIAAGDPINNGTWTLPGDSTPVIQTVNQGNFTSDGSGTSGTSGSSTTLLFNTSGTGQYGIGTCGPDGYWTDPDGNVFGPNNPNCLAYGSDGGVGNNGKGQCVTSSDGLPGLWINPGGHETTPYHSQCLRVGTTTTSLVLSFPALGQIFNATDGSGDRVLNYYLNGVTVAQLLYDGATGTTVGAGMLVGTDNASPAHIWTIYFAQPALTYLGGFPNGDLIDALTSGGLQVVACNTTLGCSLVNLEFTVIP